MSDIANESPQNSQNKLSHPQQMIEQLNTTDQEQNYHLSQPNTRPITALTRNLSEMSIECSTTLSPAPAAVSENTEPLLILDDMNRLSASNKLLIQEKVKTVFELPDSETLVNEFPCYLIRLVTIPGWMYITNNHICFYASLPGKKEGPHKAGYLSKKNHITSPRTNRYYFELRNHVLSWYSSAESKYLPLNSVDLKCITKIEPSKLKKHGIRLSTTYSNHYTIIADSELSQKEWMDELKKGVFVAQHVGNSVRIVLPFSKIIVVEKPSVFQFAANIKIKFMDDIAEGSEEDYYFAFFPDIEMAYNEFMTAWKSHVPSDVRLLGADEMKKLLPTTRKAVNNSSFPSFDSFLENMSPAALPTILMGKLMNVTSLFQVGNTNNNSGNTAATPSGNHLSEEEDEELFSDNDNHEYEPKDDNTSNRNHTSPSLLSSIKIPSSTNKSTNTNNANLTTSPTEMASSTSYLSSKKLKRNSLFFNGAFYSSENYGDHNTTTTSEDSTPKSTTRLRSGTFNHFSKIPRVVTDAIKHQVHRAEETSSVSSASSKQQPQHKQQHQNRKRGRSLSTLRHHISPFYLYNKIHKDSSDNSCTLPSVNTAITSKHSGDISLIPSATTPLPTTVSAPKTRAKRATSIGSVLLSGGSKTWHKLTPSSGDDYFQQQHLHEHHHRYFKGPMWLNKKITKELKEVEEQEHNRQHVALSIEEESLNESVVDIPASLEHEMQVEEKSCHILKEEQQTMNQHFNAYFPMLLETEVVEATFKSSFWRTIPYSGKIYITDRYFCFHSKILAGRQKLIVPWTDVIQVKKLKSKSYYLLHGMTMIVKDMVDEIFFEFLSMELRDNCFAVCQLKYENKTLFDGSSIYSKDSQKGAFSMSSVFLDRPEHIEPPTEYDGPPLLSKSSIISKPFQKYNPPEKSLHFTCLTIGSQGDVQPYVALCKELQKDGHRCRIATHPEYENWIVQHGIEFRSIGGDPAELMKLCIDNSFLSVSFIRDGTKFFYSWFEALLESSYEACQGTDVIIESPSAMIGVHMAEKLQVPYFRSMPFPFSRTTKFPHPFAMQSTAGGRIYNDMTYVMIDMALWAGTAKYVNRFRRHVLGLPSTNLDRLQLWKVPYIYSFSPTVVHPPKDWPDFIHCTGYWFLDNADQAWQPDPSLLAFIQGSTRPIVYIGFGSIIVPDAVETTTTIVNAVLKSGVKAIICKGWSTRSTAENKKATKQDDILLDQHPDTIYQLDAVPHDWLFPQIQGVVHHGGAGTTAAGLRAGLPTVIKPFFGDQRFWGQRVEELQVGLCINKLTKNQLSDALITITQNKTIIAKAQAMGDTIRKENGPRNAVESIYREFEFAKEQRISNSSS